MRRLFIVLVLGLTAVVWPAASSAAATVARAQAVGGLEADFNNDGFADLAVGAPTEAIGNLQGAGAVNVLYGSAGGLTGTGSQVFWQGPGGVAGTLEAFDGFGAEVSTGDFNDNGAADLAVGVPHEAIGSRFAAGAVNVLNGGSGGLTGTGSQGFWQGAGGVAGTAEADDQFGLSLINSDD